MIRWIVLFIVCVLVSLPAQAGLIRDRMAARAATRDLNVLRDVAYGADAAQKMDVYSPHHPKGAPVIVFVHGGGWRTGDKANPNVITNKVPYWVGKGAIVVSVNYRMLPTDVYSQAADVARAIAFVQKNAASWGGDISRMAVSGHSAGAHLIMLVANDPALASGILPWRASVVLDSAAYDIPRLMQAPHLPLYDNAFGADQDFWRRVSPHDALRGRVPPALLVCSSQRRESCPVAQAYAAKAGALGNMVEVLPQDMTHAEINANLGTPGAYTDAVDVFLKVQELF